MNKSPFLFLIRVHPRESAAHSRVIGSRWGTYATALNQDGPPAGRRTPPEYGAPPPRRGRCRPAPPLQVVADRPDRRMRLHHLPQLVLDQRPQPTEILPPAAYSAG